MNHELGQSLGLEPEESNWRERAELARTETPVNSEPKVRKVQKAPHYIKVIEYGHKQLDGYRSIKTEWVRCPDCRNGYHGH